MIAEASALAKYVVATEHEVQANYPSPASIWLENSDRGAYTTARTVGSSSVYQLTAHIRRLAESSVLMMQADIRNGVPGAEEIYNTHAASLGNPDTLRPRVSSVMRSAIKAYRTADPNDTSNVKVTVLVTWDDGGSDVMAHVSALSSRPTGPVRVEVADMKRTYQTAKDSEWVRERRYLERTRQERGLEEIIMCESDSGRMLEGLSSNFFVVVNGTVETAGSGVLLGTVRATTLEVAKRLGIPVVLRAPCARESMAWEGAFLTSTSRLLLPITNIEIDGLGGCFTGRSREFKCLSPTVARLKDAVLDAVRAESEPLWE